MPAAAPESQPAPPSGFDADVPCPHCEYNLRGLTVPRCPECGEPFYWESLLSQEAAAMPVPLSEFLPNMLGFLLLAGATVLVLGLPGS